MSDCLHCDINDLVQKRLESKDANLADMAASMTESLVDLILLVPAADQATLMAEVVGNLGQAFLEKSGSVDGDSTARH